MLFDLQSTNSPVSGVVWRARKKKDEWWKKKKKKLINFTVPWTIQINDKHFQACCIFLYFIFPIWYAGNFECATIPVPLFETFHFPEHSRNAPEKLTITLKKIKWNTNFKNQKQKLQSKPTICIFNGFSFLTTDFRSKTKNNHPNNLEYSLVKVILWIIVDWSAFLWKFEKKDK